MTNKTMCADPLILLEQLEIVDPECARIVSTAVDVASVPTGSRQFQILVEETLWALTIGISFGRCVAGGYAGLMGRVNRNWFLEYRTRLREAGANGVTLGCLMAEHLCLVMQSCNEPLLDIFFKAIDILLKKGTYAVKPTLETLKFLITSNDPAAAVAYLDLVSVTFSKAISYNRSIYFTQYLPRRVKAFPAEKRISHIRQLNRVMETDQNLFDPFLDGLDNGLGLLEEDALSEFVSKGLETYGSRPAAGIRFLSLSSSAGISVCETLQTSAHLILERSRMARYAKARIGKSVPIRPISAIPGESGGRQRGALYACCDGASIYLPDQISCFDTKKANRALYKVLTKLETGLMEFGTFAFDIEKVFDQYKHLIKKEGCFQNDLSAGFSKASHLLDHLSDMEAFWSLFPSKQLAKDLFTLFEHARIINLSKDRYVGLVRQVRELFEAFLKLPDSKPITFSFLYPLYETLAMGGEGGQGPKGKTASLFKTIEKRFYHCLSMDKTVSLSGIMVICAYGEIENRFKTIKENDSPGTAEDALPVPMGRQLRPDLFFLRQAACEKMTRSIHGALRKNRIKVYRSDIRQILLDLKGKVTIEDIAKLVTGPEAVHQNPGCQKIDLSWLDLEKILERPFPKNTVVSKSRGKVFRYREWSAELDDYLQDHVRVLEKKPAGTHGNFYGRVLSRHRGLVKKVKRSFEMLRPEGLLMLRPWKEGDDFDYRALLDFAIDRQAGLIPSDRLYIKRIKQHRDVAVLVLVDVSRSTANHVEGTGRSVLDVEKEALVLFCEALDVVGDAFAVAGFSGTGPLGVDYYTIKDFSDPVDEGTMERIGAMIPRRSTRMGAAIRHAASCLDGFPAKVKLMIVIGDGFPNDLEYKGTHAVADTRKSIMEARSRNIHVKAVTVNISEDIRLDNLYGDVHHTVITNVRELPDRLLSVYGRLTRN